MRHRVALLDPLVVPGRDDLVAFGQHRADGHAAFVQAGPGLAQGQRHHLPVGLIYLPVSHAGLRYRTRRQTTPMPVPGGRGAGPGGVGRPR